MKKNILIYFDLITSLKTTQEVADFVFEIDTLMLTFFKSEKPSMTKALNSISSDSAKKISSFFSKNKLDVTNRDTVTNFFETIKDLAKKFKVIKLTLAFDPTPKTIANIHNFTKDALGIGYILDIEVSKDLLGGAIVVFNGKYNDYSLKKKIDDTFTLKNKEILQLYK
jgi:F0F1-type ATP synthase delta subunit